MEKGMAIEQWATGKVIPYERNPRKNDGAVDGVARSIEAFGFRQPIVVDRKGVIICGHTRWKAAGRKLSDWVREVLNRAAGP